MPKIEKSVVLDVTPGQFLNHCSPEELQELESLLISEYYQNRKNNTQQCRVCGCTDYNRAECLKITGEPCSWIEKDLCSRCDSDIKKTQIFYNTKLSQADISSRLHRKLREFFCDIENVEVDDLKISLLENFDFNQFTSFRGNGQVIRNELLRFCKKNKIPIKKY